MAVRSRSKYLGFGKVQQLHNVQFDIFIPPPASFATVYNDSLPLLRNKFEIPHPLFKSDII